MKSHYYIFKLILLPLIAALITVISACTIGPAEQTLPDSIASPASHLNKGIHQYNNNDYSAAINHFEKALLQYRSIDNQTGIAQSCMNLAKSFMAINNNQAAGAYLIKANSIIKQASLNELSEHLHLLNSSLAINKTLYEQALEELHPVLSSKNTAIQLAALKNRSKIAFIKNQNDKQQWLEKYKKLQHNNPANTSSHHARILRFESELTENTKTKANLLTQALSISQDLADRTAIAATLTQWVQIDIDTEQFDKAEDKALRALFIRHQLGDAKNSLIILKKLHNIYTVTDNKKQTQSRKWINKISNNELNDWGKLFSDFETYPRS
jgi:tetratricopeptide (TPR) repeat protein